MNVEQDGHLCLHAIDIEDSRLIRWKCSNCGHVIKGHVTKSHDKPTICGICLKRMTIYREVVFHKQRKSIDVSAFSLDAQVAVWYARQSRAKVVFSTPGVLCPVVGGGHYGWPNCQRCPMKASLAAYRRTRKKRHKDD